jgi:hypothetical protein
VYSHWQMMKVVLVLNHATANAARPSGFTWATLVLQPIAAAPVGQSPAAFTD